MFPIQVDSTLCFDLKWKFCIIQLFDWLLYPFSFFLWFYFERIIKERRTQNWFSIVNHSTLSKFLNENNIDDTRQIYYSPHKSCSFFHSISFILFVLHSFECFKAKANNKITITYFNKLKKYFFFLKIFLFIAKFSLPMSHRKNNFLHYKWDEIKQTFYLNYDFQQRYSQYFVASKREKKILKRRRQWMCNKLEFYFRHFIKITLTHIVHRRPYTIFV